MLFMLAEFLIDLIGFSMDFFDCLTGPDQTSLRNLNIEYFSRYDKKLNRDFFQ
jgi:hypothetical protein